MYEKQKRLRRFRRVKGMGFRARMEDWPLVEGMILSL